MCNLEPATKTSCHSKFFKDKDPFVVRMSFQEFLKANKLNKEWKEDLLDTHYKLGNDASKSNSVHREFMTKKKAEKWLHKIEEEDEEELLRDYFKARNEKSNFEIKDDIVTDNFGPLEVLRNRLLMTPVAKTHKKLQDFSPMTSVEFTKTNFKVWCFP